MKLRIVLAALALAFAAVVACADTTTRADASATHPAIPFKQEKQSSESLAYQSLGALVLVGLAALGIAYGLKRYVCRDGSSPRKARRLRALETMRLSRQSTLHVIEYDGQELLLAERGQGVQLIAQHPLARSPERGGGHE